MGTLVVSAALTEGASAQGFTYGADPPVAPNVYAIENARVVTESGKPIDKATVVVRDGLIVAVGPKATVPPDAKVIDATGLTLYPGFIDAFTTAGTPGPGDYPAPRGDAYQLATVRADNLASSLFTPGSAGFEARRKAGFGALHVAPSVGIYSGASAVVSTGMAKDTAALVVRSPLMLRLNFDAPDPSRGYPESLMGEIAVARQALYDAQDALRQQTAYARDPRGLARPAVPRAVLALEEVLTGKTPLVIHADSGQMILRALKFDKEFGIRPIIDGGIEAYKVIPELKEANATVLLSLNLPEPPKVKPGDEDRTTLADLRRRAEAPRTAALLEAAGVPFALSTEGMDLDKFTHNLRRVIAAGLSEDDAIAALTTGAAHILGVERQLGSIENGKIANLIAVEGGTPFDGKAKLRYVFVDGASVDIEASAAPRLAAAGAGAKVAGLSLPPGVTPAMALSFMRSDPNSAKPFLPAGVTVEDAIATLDAIVNGKPAPATEAPAAAEAISAPPVVGEGPIFPLPPQLPPSFVLRGATVWTVGPKGTLPDADVYVSGGIVHAVGPALKVPAGTLEIDARGKQITPGIIDCHSHTAIEGGINEGTNIVTAECRIGDVLNAEDVNIYRELAGGTTTANVLHGSANAIGGQNAVVKWRWGMKPDDLLLQGAPPGVKFALGENPKQSNWSSDSPRYPSTRMGVEKVIRQALMRARDYQNAWKDFQAGRRADPPRRDLQLDALAEVLEGKRFVHCHSYRQDEILMLIRLADEFGFRIRTFQHGLEGYKIADEIAAHGAGVSTFSDWWAYKIEAYDAIPYNAALLEAHGVVTSVNSDSDELARRLSYEAAKGIHWGGMKPDEAIKLVTINPAKQLGIDHQVGSLEPGKDADLVVWSGDPLSSLTICEKTFVDGKLYFDRQADLAARAGIEAERRRLLDAEKPPAPPAEKKAPASPAIAATAPPFAGGSVPVVAGAPVPANLPTTPAAPVTAAGTATVPPVAATPAAVPSPASTAPVAPGLAPLPQKPNNEPVPTSAVTAFVGATVHPISGPEIPNGVVLMQGSKIVAVGAADSTLVPAGATTVNVAGKQIYPGLFDAHTQLGLEEIGSIRATNDDNERGDLNPDLRAETSVNPDSELIPVARQNGILTAVTAPNGGTISGIGAVISLSGWTWEDMTIDRGVGMFASFPNLGTPRYFDSGERDTADFLTAGIEPPAAAPASPAPASAPAAVKGAGDAGPDAEAEKAEKPLNDLLEEARRYRTAILAEGARDVPAHPRDARFDALLPVLDGRMPLMLAANRAREIRAAVAWAKSQNIRMVLVGGDEADKCADLLAAANIPVILDPVLRLPQRRDLPYDDAYTLPLRLYRAGVRFCIATNDAADVRRLPYQAAMAAAFGLPQDVAMRAITLSPAEILGEANRLGSIEAGKDATLIVTDGNPLEITTSVEQAWIRGAKVDLSTRQTRLYDKYRARPMPKPAQP